MDPDEISRRIDTGTRRCDRALSPAAAAAAAIGHEDMERDSSPTPGTDTMDWQHTQASHWHSFTDGLPQHTAHGASTQQGHQPSTSKGLGHPHAYYHGPTSGPQDIGGIYGNYQPPGIQKTVS